MADLKQWTEHDFHLALAHLESLADDIMALRATVPSLIAPLTRRNSTKEMAFAGLKKAALNATADVGGFRKKWEGERTREIMERVKVSQEGNGDLSRQEEIGVYGWGELIGEGKDEEDNGQEIKDTDGGEAEVKTEEQAEANGGVKDER